MLPSLARVLGCLWHPYLDLQLRSGGDTITRIMERPAQWMEAPELAALRRDLSAVAARTLGQGELAYGAFDEDGDRLSQSVVTLITRRSDGQPIAFNVLAIIDLELNSRHDRVLHLGLVMVDPEARGSRLSALLYGLTCLLLFLRGGLRPVWISNVTQVPAVVGMVSETFSGVHPTPSSPALRDFRHLLLARRILRDHRHVFGVGPEARFDEERFVIENAYTGGSDALKKSFEATAHHRDAIYNDFCRKALDYERGDDVVQLGQLDLAAMARYLRRSVPGRMLPGLLAAAVPLVLGRALLPALHWLQPRRAFGVLRERA